MSKEKSAQVRASMKYNAKNVRQIKINLNIKNDLTYQHNPYVNQRAHKMVRKAY